MQQTGASALLKALTRSGVTLVFGYPGGAIMPVYDALYDYTKTIRHVLVRHEQGAVHAAQGYARASGNVGVCLVTSGPGATNLVTGIADAQMDSTPLVCITGQVSSHLLGTEAFQETNIIAITKPITKWNYQITDANEIPKVLEKAFMIARMGRPGPVVIDITKDAQLADCTATFAPSRAVPKTSLPRIQEKHIRKAADLLNRAKRPYILMGHGVLISRAEKALRALAEKGDIPVASTLHGLSGFPTHHPLYVGLLGMHGNYGTNVLSNRADVVLAVGMRFDDRVTGRLNNYLPHAKIIHIDIEREQINKLVRVMVPIIADAKDALLALLPHVKKNYHVSWRKEFQRCDKREYAKVIKQEIQPRRGQLTMAEVVHMLAQKTRGNAAVVADVGQHQMVAARYSRFTQSRSWFSSGGLGTMGYALPASIGVQFAFRRRTVVAIIGDGGFQMTLQELATIAQEKLPIKIIILNNHYLGMVRQWQELFFQKRYSMVDLKNPDFIAIARAFSLPAERVHKRKNLSSALDRMLRSRGAYFLDIHVKKEENVFPMMPSGASVDEMRLA